MSSVRTAGILTRMVLSASLIVPSAGAGDYHDGKTLICSDCHVVHLRTARPPDAAEESLPNPTEATGPTGDPLLRDSVNDLCLSCHDNSTRAADVLGANLGRSPGEVRQAGFLNRLGSVGSTATGHTLEALEPAPGSQPSWKPEDENGAGVGLACINCHAPHGQQGLARAYRNLRADAGNNRGGEGLVTYNDGKPGLNDLSRDVFVRRTLAYDESAVDFNEPNPSDSAIARFCAGCHNTFHGNMGGPAIGGSPRRGGYAGFLRHPAAGVNIGATGGAWSSNSLFISHAQRVKVMSESGVWDPPGRDVTPTCISCHKAHGNANAFGLIFRSGQGTRTENGDTRGGTLEHLCGQCHGQAVAQRSP
ncbi:MAG: hypothetical protein AB1486_27345 [Planctomycetota bacterium]